MRHIPQNRKEVQKIVAEGGAKDLHDAEYDKARQEMGARIVARRHELSLTQAELSEKTGLSAATLHRLEKGLSAPSVETLLILCEALKTSSDYLLGLRIRNYDDIMQDPKAAHVVKMLLRFSNQHKERVLEYIRFLNDVIIPKKL